MTMQANRHRHLGTFFKNRERPWEWWALGYGWAQPKRFAIGQRIGPWYRWPVRFHLTPIHFEHWANTLEIGICIGKRTLYLMRHR